MPTERVPAARFGAGELWALAGAIAYALNHVFLNVAVRGTELNNTVGATVQALPILVFSLAMWPSANRRDPEVVSPMADWKLASSVVANSVLMFVVAVPLLFAAFRHGGVLLTTPVTGTQVLWGALLAAILLREPFTWRMGLGMLVSVGGVTLLAVGQSGDGALSSTWWLAVPYAAGAALCWAIGGVLLTYAMRRHVDRYQALAVFGVIGIALINLMLVTRGEVGVYRQTPPGVLLSLITAGLFNMAALVSLTTALSLTTVASATMLNSLQVPLAPLIAWIVVDEQMNSLIGLGILLVLVGVIVVQRARLAIEPEHIE